MKTEKDGLALPNEVEVEEESKFKKVFIITLGIIVILLILSYFWIGFPLGDIIKGRIESTPLIGNKVIVDNLSILFENNTFEQINAFYFQEQKNEFSLCLLGENRGQEYIITSFYQPKMYQQYFNQVTFEPCSQETLILLHTHPYKSCIASSTDFETLNKTKLLNPKVLMVVMCEPKRFSVYG